MADVKGMDLNDGKIELRLSISADEYKVLQHNTADIVVLPSGKGSLTYLLTTGKLGNSNRLMLPKKFLESFNITELDKKVQSNIFALNDDAFLLIKIKRSKLGIPVFNEGSK